MAAFKTAMPRQSRLDTPGALHHIIARGIERRKIFDDDEDRYDFIERLGPILHETNTACYAWALLPNHFHLLLRTGTVPIATVMRRLLTGHAIGYNRRHRRYGHLFQNRYKSILCQEDSYLLELVRYIHPNPLRTKLVVDVDALGKYPFSGHGVIMGKTNQAWQDIETVLAYFGKLRGPARPGRGTQPAVLLGGARVGCQHDLLGPTARYFDGGGQQVGAKGRGNCEERRI